MIEKLMTLLEEAEDLCSITRCEDCAYNGQDCWLRLTANCLIDHGIATQRWIPVTERLPDTEGVYLVCAGRFGIVMAYYIDGRFGGGCVSHWMPLPTPPESLGERKE